MPRVVSLLWSGSTLLTRRPILTLNTLSPPKKIVATAWTVSVLRNSPCALSQGLCLWQARLFSTNRPVRDKSSVVCTALKMKKCVVVGISGVTNGGKTTLCEQLERDLPMATHINMDDYFYSPTDGKIPVVEELNHGNYEDPRAINFDQMVKDVDQWVTDAADKPVDGQPQILFLEGILIFNHKPLVPYYSLKYFLTLTKDQCWERRKHRRYDPPDPPGYFDIVVWPMYLKNKYQLKNQQDIVYLDGTDKPENTYKRVLADLKAQLEGEDDE